MAFSNLPTADAGQFERYLRRATWRIRLERLRAALGVMIWVLLAAAVIWTAGLLFNPEWALGAPVGVLLAVILLVLAADAALFWPLESRQALLRLDRKLDLADGALSASELTAADAEEWRRRQLAQTLTQLQGIPWNERWPLYWPRLNWLGAATLLVLGALLLQAYFVERAIAQPEASPFLRAQIQALEEVFKDWEEAEKKFDDEALREQLAELKPLREQMLAGKLSEKDMLVALSRIEEKLTAARKALDAQSLESSAGELASAFEPIEGMSALAAALRRKDFGLAEKLAAAEAEKLAQPESKLPAGAEKAENQQRMEKTAQSMKERGQESAASAMQKMAEGMKEGDGQKTREGMQAAKKSFGGQARREDERKRLSQQLAQMGECKDGLGSGQGQGKGMSLVPRLSESKQRGDGAGSGIDPNRFGAETKLASQRTEENLTGQISEGDTEITTEKAERPTREQSAGARAARFHEYDKLSREAIEDENIPIAHRQAIRKYFEMIRPAEK